MPNESERLIGIIEHDKHGRIASEGILLAINDNTQSIPATIATEAVFEAHTIDSFLPVLIMRANSKEFPVEENVKNTILNEVSSLREMLNYMKRHQVYLDETQGFHQQ